MPRDEGESHPERRVNQRLAELKKQHERLHSLRLSMDDELLEAVDRQRKHDSINNEAKAELSAKYNVRRT